MQSLCKVDRPNWVYMMSNCWRNVIYTGSTSDLISRVEDHKARQISGFSKKYNTVHLIYYELAKNMDSALAREHRVKKWLRPWKDELVETMNPDWEDLFEQAKVDVAKVDRY